MADETERTVPRRGYKHILTGWTAGTQEQCSSTGKQQRCEKWQENSHPHKRQQGPIPSQSELTVLNQSASSQLVTTQNHLPLSRRLDHIKGKKSANNPHSHRELVYTSVARIMALLCIVFTSLLSVFGSISTKSGPSYGPDKTIQKVTQPKQWTPDTAAGRQESGPTARPYASIDPERLLDVGEDEYIVVFDAGSTGTRVHVFHFQGIEEGVRLMSEVFHQQKPGLSDFADNTSAVSKYLQPLIDVAVRAVPEKRRHSTKIVFEATGGFRLLDERRANALLDRVRDILVSAPFAFSGEDVNVMEGVEEGSFTDSVAALDLGGASVQATFETSDVKRYPGVRVKRVSIFGMGFQLYTHSYLGLGLKAVRLASLEDDEEEGPDGGRFSACFPEGYRDQYKIGNTTYTISGPMSASFEKCWESLHQVVRLKVGEEELSRSLDVGNQHVYLFSYFFDILQWAGVIKKHETQKVIHYEDIHSTATKVCENAPVYTKHPFLCTDLTYISILLGDVYGFWDTQFHVVSYINSGETSWALGAALAKISYYDIPHFHYYTSH